ncbi:LysR family transcriptional regulator [Phaeobacter sp. QD34_3]|uniref:LysR family transcriptional regulator n=1 Tax=unclassified Phaeobacter TaxID=2621772 RepID=UPI00237F4344|nr:MULTISPECIES: LysR family transcriptional regulator [unclassified Phaeobacter]MDE4133669.1 LysR family transcriptional regulator [Phaeobacter sp. QD34_3]MDE4137398.1 LysR family transcriptional regulator [Phaeobacter sp. QD34_24]
MKLDPRHLEILAAIVEHGGLTEGAEALGKSQPSVSRTLSQLEARIGAPLFKPGRRPLQPTDLGLALAEQGQAVLKANAKASDLVARFRTGHSGLVRVAGTPIFMDGVIASMIARFQQEIPDVRVDQSYGYADPLIERLRLGTLDIAIVPLRRSRVPADLSFQPILQGLNVVVCRENHPLTRSKFITAKEIENYPWIAPPADSPLYKDLRRALSNIGAEDFRISCSGGSLASVIGVLTGSDSLTILPYSVVFMMKDHARIAALSLDIGHPDRELGLLVASEAQQSPAARRFRTFVHAQFESLSRRIVQHRKDQLWR